MDFIPSKCKQTINLDAKMHGGFSLVSYAVDFSIKLGYTEGEKNKIINDLITSKSFEDMLKVFKHNFDEIAVIQYRYKNI